MTALNKHAELRQLAEKAQEHGVFNMDIHSETVLALLDELEAAKQDSARWFKAFEKAVSIGARYEERIAELEARTVTLPPTFWYEHDDLSRDIPVLDKRLVKKAIRAAGIGVKGE